MTSRRGGPLLGGLLACLVVAAACGSGPGASGAAGGSVAAPTATDGGGSAACPGLDATLSVLAQIEAALRTGAIGDEVAEGQISTIQGVLDNASQAAGRTSGLGGAYQSVVSALGELGVQLNQNAGVQQFNPYLDAVDQAVAGLRNACAAAG